MNNYLNILTMQEKDMHRVVFIKDQEEGGINSIYDPDTQGEVFQVFIHKRLPLRHVSSWDFDSFGSARTFAAKSFGKDWELLSWDFKTKRPCEEGGKECGSGDCDTCRSIKAEDTAAVSGCSPTTAGAGACGCG